MERARTAVKALRVCKKGGRADSECLKIIPFLGRSTGGETASFLFSGAEEDASGILQLILKPHLNQRSLSSLTSGQKKKETKNHVNLLFPILPSEILGDFTHAQEK